MEGKSFIDVSGTVILKWKPPTNVSAEGMGQFCDGFQYYGGFADQSEGQPVSFFVFPTAEEMNKKFNDLIPFDHSNILMPICCYDCDGFHALSFLPVKSSLQVYLNANKSSLTNKEELGAFIFRNSDGTLTNPLLNGPLDFSPKTIDGLSMGLLALSEMHLHNHLHGPFNLNDIMVSIENEEHPVLNHFVLKLNPDKKSDGKSELTKAQISEDYGYYADAILEMCRILSMADHQILEINDMCRRMKNGDLYLVSDILKHPCLYSHGDRINILRHMKQVSGDIRLRELAGANFPKGSWLAHFDFVLERLPFVSEARLDYADDFSGFLDFARNLLIHFWEMDRLHSVMPDEVICVLRLRAYYPLLFVDLG